MSALSRIAKSAEEFFVLPHKAGLPFIAAAFLVAVAAFAADGAAGMAFLIVACWVWYFFRNPERVTPLREGIVVSPADGRVVDICRAQPPKELELPEGERCRISIFLNVCDVHVNRIPFSGTVEESHYRPGKFLNADLDKASEDNERQCLLIKDKKGREVVCVQIAGLVARRIVCDAHRGDEVVAGARYGIIRFGSRADVYLPEGVAPLVCKGQYMIGGETVLADLDAERQEAPAGVRS
jgi:phosphatidylserine decarboxylase